MNKINIAVDLRGLNYKVDSGVNIHTLHLLYQLWQLKLTKNNWQITGIGLQKKIWTKRKKQYPFLDSLLDAQISFGDYCGISFLPYKLCLLLFYVINFVGFVSVFNVRFFNYLILGQPKPIIKHPNSQLIVYFHDIYSVGDWRMQNWKNNLLQHPFILIALIKASHQIWTNSISTSRQIKQRLKINENKIKLVYPALPFLSSENSFENVKVQDIPINYILAISSPEPRKNWLNLIIAHWSLQQKYPEWTICLVLAGYELNNKYLKKLQQFVTTNGICNVVFYGDCNQSQKEALIENCLYMLYPSLWEGFGFPILEAFKHKKSVIISKVGASPEVAKEAGIYVNPLNYQEISMAMYILYKDEKFRKEKEFLGQINLKNFNWQETKTALKNMLN